MQTCFNILVGAGGDFEAMSAVDTAGTTIFWNLFMLTGAVIGLNIIIAIIMEGYERAKRQLEGSPTVLELLYSSLPGVAQAGGGAIAEHHHPTKAIDIIKALDEVFTSRIAKVEAQHAELRGSVVALDSKLEAVLDMLREQQ